MRAEDVGLSGSLEPVPRGTGDKFEGDNKSQLRKHARANLGPDVARLSRYPLATITRPNLLRGAMTYAQHFLQTQQSEPLYDKPMVQNAAGGYAFKIDDWKRLRRFLLLGCEGGTYYEGERKLTLENTTCVRRCLTADGKRTVDLIVEVSDHGLAVKNEPAVFALAVATKFGDRATVKLAFEALPKVARIGTHLFQFVEAREAIGGGWGRGMRKAVGSWYRRPDLIMQALKYQSRGGWSHRDLLRLSHPVAEGADEVLGHDVFDAICRPEKWAEIGHLLAQGWCTVQAAKTAREAAKAISEYNLPSEFVPTQFLTEPEVWASLLPKMPMTALVRNLGNLSKCGLLKPLSPESRLVASKLTDETAIKMSRLHPFSVLLAAKTYALGHGIRGSGQWIPVTKVIEALDETFNLAFHNVEPTGKRFLLGVDVSSSMSWSGVVLTSAEAAAAMALITARTEPNYYIMGFSTIFKDLNITARDTLGTVLEKTLDQNFGGTDTSVAIKWAIDNNVEMDVCVIYTDNETWAGETHTCKAIENYRRKIGIPTKLAVVAFTATERSIADNVDPGSMDFVGMDSSLPQALAAFVSES